jgi:hypothetical protein
VLDRVEQREVRPVRDAQVDVRLARRRRLARVYDDPDAAAVALLPEELVEDGERLGRVRAREDEDFGERYVVPRVRRAVYAESLIVARGGRDHAEAAVVVNVSRPQPGARELAHQVSLLGRQGRSRIDADGVLAVPLLKLFELRDDEVERLVPRRAVELPVALDQRIEQPVWMMNLKVGRDALRAQAALVDRKVVARLEADDVVLFDE